MEHWTHQRIFKIQRETKSDKFKNNKALISSSTVYPIYLLCRSIYTFVCSNTKAIDCIVISKSYIYTQSGGCFAKITGKQSAIISDSVIGSQLSTKLHTTSTSTVNDDTISFINHCICNFREKEDKQVINLCNETKEDGV